MDTAALKSFATSARTELIREVGARITAVLAQGSSERVEQPQAVAALERAVAARGGSEKGTAHVADKVAYTWFNRIIALRFMDANGYTGIGVVSPAADQVGQPEVLAAAKRGQFDRDVVKRASAAIVSGLLNGTRQPRPGVGAQAEAYAVLLADYCRYWNGAMPFMFEREGDYTELLIPANLLAEDSVLSRSVTVLTEDVCQDVEVIGWLYQFYISERKDEVFAGFKKNKKAGSDEIPAATQLFTPHWIVRYLVENSLGRLWMLNHPQSRLVDQMDYYIAPVDEETDFLKITTPEELKVIDPACGSGHMLTYAFDLLYAIYEEEGYTPSQIPSLILTNNLYGTEIDQRAGALAAFALTMKAAAQRRLFLKNPVEPNICVLAPVSFSAEQLSYLVTNDGDRPAEEAFWNQFAEADTFGSLIRPDPALTVRLGQHIATLEDEGDLLRGDALEWAQRVIDQATYLSRDYAVVVANPPYMGSKQMNAQLSQFMKDEYPTGKADLMTAFMLKAQVLTTPGGTWAMINLPSWMSLKSFEDLRHDLLRDQRISSMVHLGRGVFGSDFGSVAFVVGNAKSDGGRAVYRRLFEQHVDVRSVATIEALFRDRDYNRFEVAQSDFASIPGSPIVYWLSENLRRIFVVCDSVGDRFDAIAGISTGDNARFFRFWHEVSAIRIGGGSEGAPWAPHHKGGASRKWAGNVEHVLRYAESSVKQMTLLPGFRHDGNADYFKPHVGWSALTSGPPSFRAIPAGCTFGSGSKALMISGDAAMMQIAVLNSTLTLSLLRALSPTMNYEVGHILSLPMTPFGADEEIVARVGELISVSQYDWDSDETSRRFSENPLVARSRAD